METLQIIISSLYTLVEIAILIFSIYYFAKTSSSEGILLIIGSAILLINSPLIIIALNFLNTYFQYSSNSMIFQYRMIILQSSIGFIGYSIFSLGFILLVLKIIKNTKKLN